MNVTMNIIYNNRIKIAYAGYNLDTFFCLLNSWNVDISGVIRMEFSDFKTINPANLFFRVGYFLRKNGKYALLESTFCFCWKNFFRFFSSGIYSRLSNYIIILIEKKINIINYKDLGSAVFLIVDTWEIIPNDILQLPVMGSINIHPSILPKYAGALPTLWSLKNDDNISGVTYFKMGKKIDGGDIISQHFFDVDESDDYLSVEKKIKCIVSKTLVSDIINFRDGLIVPKRQDFSIRSSTEKYEVYKEIKFSLEKTKDIYNKTNLYPYLIPGEYCYYYLGRRKIFLKRAFKNNKESESRFFSEVLIHRFKCSDGHIFVRLFIDVGFINSLLILLKK